MRPLLLSLVFSLSAVSAMAQPIVVATHDVTEWKSVFGQVETRDRLPARARIGGTVESLAITEGDRVTRGQPIATIRDDKLDFRIDALDARLSALTARLETATTDLERGRQLRDRGVITNQRFDELQTAVSVLQGEIAGTEAEKLVVARQIDEGTVLAPGDGIVLSVPISRGSVLNPGETLAEIGGGGVYLRLAVPERHATALAQGDGIQITTAQGPRTGIIAKIYPLIQGGRVSADVTVEGLDARFVGQRLPVRLPIATRKALLVPEAALTKTGGLDFVTVETATGPQQRVVLPGARVTQDGTQWREILTGLMAGETVVQTND